METARPRALRIRPMLAAVMPLPREEVTPPVTKTYFAMDRILRGFFRCYRKMAFGATTTAAASGPRQPRRGPGEGAAQPVGSGGSVRPGPQASGPQKKDR